MVEQGLDVAATDAMLLRKIEEITLHMIQLNHEMQEMRSENERLREEVERLESKTKR